MSGNRVDELEAKVRELEATIEGLTDELVETKERLGAIEDETGIEPDALESRLSRTSRNRGNERSEADDEGPEGADSAERAETTDGDDADDETADSTGDDIIVA
ncbi:MAG: hypothetical protein ACI9TI_000217 [Natronomonas sp.]|jgi:hypothetical protein|uniref:DUF7518 family protein n=1 Tax=Natronomonas sp. TaxID=2184060 RepID=UPI003989D86E